MWGYKKGFKKEDSSEIYSAKNFKSSSVIDIKEYGSLFYGDRNLKRLFKNSNLLINGIPAKFDVYTSKRSISKVISKYEKDWRIKGLEVVRKNIGNMHIVSGFDANQNLFECVMITKDQETKKNLVIPAELDLSRRPVETKYKTPLYPSSQPLLHIESMDMGVYSENIMFLSEANVSSIMNYYRNKFIQQGWQEVQQNKNQFISPNSGYLLLLKDQDELWVNANWVEDENKTFIYLLYNDK
jgi:hypothetical protein